MMVPRDWWVLPGPSGEGRHCVPLDLLSVRGRATVRVSGGERSDPVLSKSGMRCGIVSAIARRRPRCCAEDRAEDGLSPTKEAAPVTQAVLCEERHCIRRIDLQGCKPIPRERTGNLAQQFLKAMP